VYRDASEVRMPQSCRTVHVVCQDFGVLSDESFTCSMTQKIVRADAPLTADVGGELVMLSPEHGEYFGLNAVGSRIWELIAEPRAFGELCARLTDEFEVDEETCRAEALAFLRQLAEVDLVRVGP
jgi:hypothetical protein